jgi:hypothetical protein
MRALPGTINTDTAQRVTVKIKCPVREWRPGMVSRQCQMPECRPAWRSAQHLAGRQQQRRAALPVVGGDFVWVPAPLPFAAVDVRIEHGWHLATILAAAFVKFVHAFCRWMAIDSIYHVNVLRYVLKPHPLCCRAHRTVCVYRSNMSNQEQVMTVESCPKKIASNAHAKPGGLKKCKQIRDK